MPSIYMTISDAIRNAVAKLSAAGIETPRLDAEVILRSVLQTDRTQLYTRLRESIDPNAYVRFLELIERRAEGSPVAYVTQSKSFMDHSFTVGPGVLVPRPETEILVEWAIDEIRKRRSARIIDVGTGSGAIILSIAYTLRGGTGLRFVGVDRSREALDYAVANRRHLDLAPRVSLVQGDLLEWSKTPYDVVLANLPYLRPDQVIGNLELAEEPVRALVGGDDGLDLIRALILDLPRVLAPGAVIGLEIDPSQSSAVAALVESTFGGKRVEIIRDLAGLDRFVTARPIRE